MFKQTSLKWRCHPQSNPSFYSIAQSRWNETRFILKFLFELAQKFAYLKDEMKKMLFLVSYRFYYQAKLLIILRFLIEQEQ